MSRRLLKYIFFFFNDTATTEIYTLSLHDALPISDIPLKSKGESRDKSQGMTIVRLIDQHTNEEGDEELTDRKSTRLNSSHSQISYAVFCLKKKKKPYTHCTGAYCAAIRV